MANHLCRLQSKVILRELCRLKSDSPARGSMAVENIKATLDMAGPLHKEELVKRLEAGDLLYKQDCTISMRSCEKEVVDPIHGTTTGTIPKWLKGTLLRNGAGETKIGDSSFQHPFDGSALIHRFAINDGKVSYQCRFLKSNAYVKNHAANRIVMNEFGTRAVPDPCQSIFKRVSAIFNPDSFSDNAMISIYPFGDEFYCFTESPTIWRINPTTLETMDSVNVMKHVAIVNHTSHPHVTADGSVYNQAMSIQSRSPHYSIVKFPSQSKKSAENSSGMFEKAEIVASVKARWGFHPSYMHTFGITDHYYVIIEQPLTISMPGMLKAHLFGEPPAAAFRYFENENTLIHVVERDSGNIFRTYQSEAFFYFHTVNQYEKDGHLVIDICCYSDPKMMECLYFEEIKNMNKNPDYARLFRGRPFRFVLPLDPKTPQDSSSSSNLVTLSNSSAAASWKGSEVHVKPELLCNFGLELPRFNYNLLGKPYRYFYGVSSDVDLDNPGSIIKVDIEKRTENIWGEPNVYASEPIFVPSPDGQNEDDGVLLSALVWGQGLEKQVGLLVLDAASMNEISRTIFQTPSAVPGSLHGWYTTSH